MNGYVFWVTGDRARGLGHIIRSLQLGAELVRRGCGVTFCTEHETPGAARLQKSIYSVEDYHPLDWSWMKRYNAAYVTLIIDVENGPARDFLEAAQFSFQRVVVVAGSGYTLIDWTAVQELSDLVICQSLIEAKSDKVSILSGVEYIMIDPAFAQLTPNFGGPIVIAMGGTDPHELTPKAQEALQGIGREVLVMNGNADSLQASLTGASLLVGALGMSAYEAAAAGVPSLLTGWSPDHVMTADQLEVHDCAQSLGLWSDFDGAVLRDKVDALLADKKAWNKMSKAGKALVNGGGVSKVADRLMALSAPPVEVEIETDRPWQDLGYSDKA